MSSWRPSKAGFPLSARVLIVLLAIASLLGAVSCGIDSILYVPEPVAYTPGSDYMYFYHDRMKYDLNSFKGYDIYYKIYSQKTDASTDNTQIQTKNNFPGEAYDFITQVLKYEKMVMLRTTTGGFEFNENSIAVSDDEASEMVTISFSDLFNQTEEDNVLLYFGNEDINPEHLYRGLSTNTELKYFSNISQSDADVKYNATSTDAYLTIQAYIFAVAYDMEKFSNAYSKASYLGVIENVLRLN